MGFLGTDFAEVLAGYLAPLTAFWKSIDEENQLIVLAVTLVASGVCLLISRYCGHTKPTLQRKSKKILLEKREFVNTHVKSQKAKLYSEYLKQSVSDHDL